MMVFGDFCLTMTLQMVRKVAPVLTQLLPLMAWETVMLGTLNAVVYILGITMSITLIRFCVFTSVLRVGLAQTAITVCHLNMVPLVHPVPPAERTKFVMTVSGGVGLVCATRALQDRPVTAVYLITMVPLVYIVHCAATTEFVTTVSGGVGLASAMTTGADHYAMSVRSGLTVQAAL